MKIADAVEGTRGETCDQAANRLPSPEWHEVIDVRVRLDEGSGPDLGHEGDRRLGPM